MFQTSIKTQDLHSRSDDQGEFTPSKALGLSTPAPHPPGKDKTKLVRVGFGGATEWGEGRGDALEAFYREAGEPGPGAVHGQQAVVSPKERTGF